MKRKATYTKGNVSVDVVRSNSEVCLIMSMKINGKEAYLFDFGTMKDLHPEKAPSCGCGDRSFVPKAKKFAPALLQKYDLSEKDGEDLMDILVNELHIGYCKRCR